MRESERRDASLYINREGGGEIDLHGFHPHDDDLTDAIDAGLRGAHERHLPTLTIIHGHGHNRPSFGSAFVNSNTGWLGRSVRNYVRHSAHLREWMFAKFDCKHDGSTTVRIRVARK